MNQEEEEKEEEHKGDKLREVEERRAWTVLPPKSSRQKMRSELSKRLS